MDLDAVTDAMRRAFARTGADTPGWPDPHPDRQPRDEEYSRMLDPGKYRIIAARLRAWTAALTELGLAVAEPLDDPLAAWHELPWQSIEISEAWRVRPARRGALPLVVCLTDFGGARGNGLALGAGDPAVDVARIPDCGCDACDTGSDDLLEHVDESVGDVVSGSFVHVTVGDALVWGRRAGWAASGDISTVAVEEALRDARAGTSPYPTVRGEPWLVSEPAGWQPA